MSNPPFPPFDAANAAFEAFKPRTALGPIDARLVGADESTLVLEMTMSDAARQPMGLLHGGVSMVLAESAASFHAALLVDINEKYPVGIEINGSHMRSIREGTVRAVCRLIRRSRTLVVHEIDILHAETDKLLCRSRVSNLYRNVDAGS